MSKRKNDENKNLQPLKGENPLQSEDRQHTSSTLHGTTDLDNNDSVAGRMPATDRGSGATTKRNVTGSDYDGQVAP